MTKTIIYQTAKIITMDSTRPVADHVVVRDGRILEVGGDELVDKWDGSQLDIRLSDCVLMPGFVEGHAHMMDGAMWRYCYVGYQDRIDPDGVCRRGLQDVGSVIAALRQAEAVLPDGVPLIAWGFDPIFLPTERLNRGHLDQVSTERPVAVLHSNFHLTTVNSAALALVGYTSETKVEGVLRSPNGQPSGELREFAAMFPILRRLRVDFSSLSRDPDSVRAFGRSAARVGVTTSADLLNDLREEDLSSFLDVAGTSNFPIRIVAALNGMNAASSDTATRAFELRERSVDRFRMGAVKIITDGSIQGYTARLKSPGYIGGEPNGIWNVSPVQLKEMVRTLHSNGVQMHIHVNGDEASEAALDALQLVLKQGDSSDHRHTLQHCQMADESQFRRMALLGLSVNLFANHIWYFGDQHYDLTIGQDRANRINACRSALDNGVPLAIHSDAPITPMAPLFTAWCAVNRKTPSGRTLGEHERISVGEALRAITLGAAHTLGLEREIGSIEIGKKADFAVLGADPTTVSPSELKDVPVLGTIQDGRIFLS